MTLYNVICVPGSVEHKRNVLPNSVAYLFLFGFVGCNADVYGSLPSDLCLQSE